MTEKIVIIGAGQAGAQAIASLRAEGFAGDLTLLGDEAFAPYQRPPLSKAYLAGALERERLFLKPDSFYAETRCDLRLGAAAGRIDRAGRRVHLAGADVLAYDKLLLATGARVRRIDVPGATLANIFYLRGIADVDAIRARFEPGARLVVVGGGYIGLEVAAVAAKLGLRVTIVEMADRVMARTASPELSAFYEAEHRAHGVAIETGAVLEAFEGDGRVQSVRAGGRGFAADLAIVGAGVLPNVELAKEAGLACDNGVVVDECAGTSDPDIFAAGDCTNHPALSGGRVRLESVQNAIDQAKHAALAMLGRPKPYREVPWFWSDQYDLKLQIAGLARPGDTTVLRGVPAMRKFAVFHLRAGALAAVEAVNAAPEYIVGRKLIAEGKAIAPGTLADASVPMKSLA